MSKGEGAGQETPASLDKRLPPLDPDAIETETCVEIWLSVIERAFQDAKWAPGDDPRADPVVFLENYNARATALTWLRGNSHDFHMVCGFASVRPEFVRTLARRTFGAEINRLQTPLLIHQARAFCVGS